jgi:anti-anti-sigma factor
MGQRVGMTRQRGVQIVTPEGVTDRKLVEDLSAALEQAVERGGPVVLDFTATEFLDSAAVSTIASIAQLDSAPGRRLHVVVKPKTQPARAWSIAGLVEHIPSFATTDAAVAAFPHRGG